ncbi:ABC transporter substrate-binding protein [Roseomonas elaeocarpi]|uniref:ABC transporter substrate-binding protein n=1 Tax=Roseomonas elaeocarpi TaxID=907779 RepID=A0ABV6JN88_9PROT
MLKTILLAGAVLASGFAGLHDASARELRSIGVTVGSLGNPFFVAIGKGATDAARAINPQARLTIASADYDLNKQFTQIDNFIASGVDLILVNAVDPRAITPAIKRAQAAGITVVGVDVAANGADATVQTNNVQAGEISCRYMAEQIGGKGNVVIQNGPQVSAVIDRVNGCKQVLSQFPDIKLLSSDQDGKGSRDGGLNVMQGFLTRFPSLQGVFTINDPQAIGSDLAARQLNRSNIVITSVDGAPDIVAALKGNTQIRASASQDPYAMGKQALEVGNGILNGNKPENPMVLLPSTLVTRDNVNQYPGWSR